MWRDLELRHSRANVRIWLKGDVLEYEPRCVAKIPLKFSNTYRRPDADTKENPVF